MRIPPRRVYGLAASGLFVLMWFLFISSPTLTYEPDEGEDEVRVDCTSVLHIGWPTNSVDLLDENGGGPVPDHIESGGELPSDVVRNGIHRDCAERRATYTGGMALLAVPTSVLAAVAMTSRRRDTGAPTS